MLTKNLKRGPQVMLPKDCALILAYTGIEPGAKIVDAGTGSGFLAIFLATYLHPGKVYTYETDDRFIDIAKENIKSSGLTKSIKLKKADITKGISEKKVDMVTLDLKDAKKVVAHARRCLKPGGWLIVYSPTAEHLIEMTGEIRKRGFKTLRTIESIVRDWKTEYTTRPETIGLMHTGFLTFAKK
jgi:tRNA (adenine57-N1/adenine58-N1)-methyltransferase